MSSYSKTMGYWKSLVFDKKSLILVAMVTGSCDGWSFASSGFWKAKAFTNQHAPKVFFSKSVCSRAKKAQKVSAKKVFLFCEQSDLNIIG